MKAYLEIEMPTSCYYCPMTNDGFYLCQATSPFKELEDDCEECKPQWCPLLPVPPHGDLIDRDALLDTATIHWSQTTNESCFPIDEIEYASTVIPAEEEHTMEEFMYGQEGNPNDGSM